VLKARATTKPTAMMMRSPCIRKFLKPLSICSSSLSSSAGALRALQAPLQGTPGNHIHN
jgi:hypothetical protein